MSTVKEMLPIKVYVSDTKYVVLEGPEDFSDGDNSLICIHPTQVDVLIQWLQEAKKEALDSVE